MRAPLNPQDQSFCNRCLLLVFGLYAGIGLVAALAVGHKAFFGTDHTQQQVDNSGAKAMSPHIGPVSARVQ